MNKLLFIAINYNFFSLIRLASLAAKKKKKKNGSPFDANETWQLAQINNHNFDSQKIQIKQFDKWRQRKENTTKNNSSIILSPFHFRIVNSEQSDWAEGAMCVCVCPILSTNGSFYQYMSYHVEFETW